MWQTLLAVAFWVAVWQGLAVCIGHNGLFLATPLQTVQTLWRLLPTADFWHRVGFSALRILTGPAGPQQQPHCDRQHKAR